MSSQSLRFLALGDSYTVGEGVSENKRWPVLLAEALRQEGIPLSDPKVIAVTGWTTDELEAGINEAKPEAPFDFVTLLIGVNNQYRGRGIDEYREQFRGLLNRAIALTCGKASRVLVVSIPDWSVTPFAQGRDRKAIASEIDAFNAVNRAEALEAGAYYTDITSLSRDQGAMVVGDRLHPNGEAYIAWTTTILTEARKMLGTANATT